MANDTTVGGYVLNISPRYENSLDIESFSRMMKNPSYCYKFFWLEAIVNLICRDVSRTTFNEIIDEMICNAWFSVLEYHIHLSGFVEGEIRDGLENAVLLLAELSGLEANAAKPQIQNAILRYDAELKKYKEQLTNMVPYRALAGFFQKCEEPVNWDSTARLVSYIERVNGINLLPYTLGPSPKLKREVCFQDAWAEMIRDNAVPILGWIAFEKTKWLQSNNPEVPGIVYKLAPMDEKMRKLGHVRELWEDILDVEPVIDVFRGGRIEKGQYDIDHFIPWSFVLSDELWNLMPMDSSLNSSKSNKLPKWDPFFDRFAQNQYGMYRLITDESRPEFRKRYVACFKDNLHCIWASRELYCAGNSREQFFSILEKNMRPVYDSARRQGYGIWNF